MKNQKPKQLLGAKIPSEIREVLEQQAAEEDRSISQITSRLLASHPTVIKALKQNRKPATKTALAG